MCVICSFIHIICLAHIFKASVITLPARSAKQPTMPFPPHTLEARQSPVLETQLKMKISRLS